jgi:hypothetical protein
MKLILCVINAFNFRRTFRNTYKKYQAKLSIHIGVIKFNLVAQILKRINKIVVIPL